MAARMNTRPVAIVGAGPIGLITALGLAHYGISSIIFEDDRQLSLETKAGTILSRTLEIFDRYGVADKVLSKALRVDEIGEIDKKTQLSTYPVRLDVLSDETRYPFVINLPQQDLEPVLAQAAKDSGLVELRMGMKFERYEQFADHVVLHVTSPSGLEAFEASFLLGCDGGRSTVRQQMGVKVEGMSLPTKYALVDLEVDLDVDNPRDYPYLAYFSDPDEWMILVRHPHCWRFLYPMLPDAPDPTEQELRDKTLSFIGEVKNFKVINQVTYKVHHRVAQSWRQGRVILMGDAAHLITPMWALGLNTGALDASNLPWRLAWFLKGWADVAVLDGYEQEQRPLALHGSGEMAEAARMAMSKRGNVSLAMTDNNWSNAYTRTMLGVRLDVNAVNDWSLVAKETRPRLAVGARLPNFMLHTPQGTQVRVHDICRGSFTALYFEDVRRRPPIPLNQTSALRHFIVSRFDAPLDGGLRDRSLLDPGNALLDRLGIGLGMLVLVRPDEYVAAIVPFQSDAQQAEQLYKRVTGQFPVA
ncbi:MAG: FAD-binding monooxygenase [Betaproteobacteria bacterium]|nr:FAD-binding monooxygenase [Betaproteobacteria bacterium]